MQCKNCKSALNSESAYCYNCGGKVVRNRLTIKNLFEHFTETFLNYDNKFLQTLITLFTKPEVVIENYINGTRKRHVNVISYFAIALTISGLQLFILNKFYPEILDLSSIASNGTEEFQKKNLDFMLEYQSIVMMLYVPLYALMSKIVFFNHKKFNYTEHLVIFMYILAQTSIISAVFTVFAAIFGLTLGTIAFIFSLPFQILYSAYCLKRLFKLNFKTILLKTIFFLLLLILVFIAFSILMAVIMYFNGDFEQMREAKKAASGT